MAVGVEPSQQAPPKRLPPPWGARWRAFQRVPQGVRSAAASAVLLALLFVAVQIGVASGALRQTGLPLPTEVVDGTLGLLGTGGFWSDFGRTCLEIGASIVAGCALGLGAGIVFWKLPLLGRVFEPYLVSFYAVPLVLFYPMMIVLVGINAGSIIILSSIMAAIPLALNTRTGLQGIRPVHLKLARTLQCNARQTLFSIAIPAAAPMIVAGLRLAVVYALIGSIAMEFTTAQSGLGYRIRYLYETFDNTTMFANIFVVLILSVLLTVLMTLAERVLLRGRR
ncbi:ABC transporter permease [Nonomuraea rosea]|uniref:ABC transporter permease n=1 Tax=Nonomuraea rosea TaxID=638574 RepID=A0ABP6ZBG2_9ACTN